ncbi:hypothetical protein HK405_012255, partial [Cladochytrium tenue]
MDRAVSSMFGTSPAKESLASASSQQSAPAFLYSKDPADYELGKPIGHGSSAVVFIATYKPLKKTVAIKVIDLDSFERNQIEEMRKEIQIQSLSRHPNLLPVYSSFVTDSKLYIVTPFMSAGSCLDIMKTAYQTGLEENCIATILKQALQGLEYLHRNNLIHRDVKAGNLLMDEDGLVQLADFGVSSSLLDAGERQGVRKTFVGTPCWMAPEVMEHTGYDQKADIWSFGITCLELANGHAPYSKYPALKVLMLTIQNDPPTLDRENGAHRYSKSFKDLIDACLQKDPARRNAPKKRQHLIADLIQTLPPVAERPHNNRLVPKKVPEAPKGVSWDFNSDIEPVEQLPTADQPLLGDGWDAPRSSAGTDTAVIDLLTPPEPVEIK